jgi:hypothetical protein
MAAESNLRKLCKVSCTVYYSISPHPARRDQSGGGGLQEEIQYDKGFVQTRVDTEKMCLRVSYNEDGVWHNDVEQVPLPDSVFDTSNKVSRVSRPKEAMDVEEGESVQG